IGILAMLVWTRQRAAVMIAIPVLIVADSFGAFCNYYQYASTAHLYRSSERPELAVLKARQFDSKHYRVFPVDSELTWTYPMLNMFSGLPIINDYGPFWLKIYQAVTSFRPNGSMPLANLENYKVLSLLGTRYLLTDSPASRRSIEQTTLASPESRGTTVVSPGTDVWMRDGASKTNQGGFILRRADNAAYSLVQADISLRSNTNYEVSFRAEADADLSQAPLYIDLYLYPSYVSAELTRSLSTISKGPDRYQVVINSGAAAPARVFARLYTQSVTPVPICELQVKELEPGRDKAFSAVESTSNGITIFENPKALPRFRFVRRVTPA